MTATVAFGLLAVTGVASTPGSGGDPAPATFRLADGSAGCNFLESGEIACRAIGSTDALVLTRDGDVRTGDASVAWNDDTPVLQAAESWWHADFSCSVAQGALECSSGSGGVIAVGRDGEAGTVPPAFSAQD